jgi:phosphatidylglycerol:prolipoprotein diacylglycerol transferase
MPLYMNYPDWIQPRIIPGLPFYWYGMMYLVAFTLTYVLFRYQARKSQIDMSADDTMTMALWIAVSALLVARIFATTIYDPTGKFLRSPWLIFWPFDARMNFTGFRGMSYFGGLTGAVIGAALWAWRYRQPLLERGDMLVHAFPLGYTFGRIGNFINGELYGRITSSSLGIIFPNARQVPLNDPAVQKIIEEINLPVFAGQVTANLPRHPSQLYEAAGEGILLWLILWFIVRPRKPFAGFSVAIYVMGYSLIRFFIEYFRELDAGFELYTPLNLTMGQILCVLAFFAGGVFLAVRFYQHSHRPRVQTFD